MYDYVGDKSIVIHSEEQSDEKKNTEQVDAIGCPDVHDHVGEKSEESVVVSRETHSPCTASTD